MSADRLRTALAGYGYWGPNLARSRVPQTSEAVTADV